MWIYSGQCVFLFHGQVIMDNGTPWPCSIPAIALVFFHWFLLQPGNWYSLLIRIYLSLQIIYLFRISSIWRRIKEGCSQVHICPFSHCVVSQCGVVLCRRDDIKQLSAARRQGLASSLLYARFNRDTAEVSFTAPLLLLAYILYSTAYIHPLLDSYCLHTSSTGQLLLTYILCSTPTAYIHPPQHTYCLLTSSTATYCLHTSSTAGLFRLLFTYIINVNAVLFRCNYHTSFH